MLSFIKNFFDRIKPIQSLNVGYDSGRRGKPVIIMLHGIGATNQTWDVLINELDVSKYRIITIDLLGAGKSPSPDGCNYYVNDHVKYINKTIKKLHVRRPFMIVGHSMGSIIAAHYCRLYSKDVDRAILLSLPIYSKENQNIKFSHKRTDLYIKAYEFLINNKDLAIKTAKHARNVLRIKDGIFVDDSSWDGFSKSLKNTIIKQKTYDDIEKLSIPIHIIFGALDELLVQENIFELDKFKNVTITKLSGINHMINPRYAKYVAKVIDEIY